jgi:ATP-dependent RNA helicase DDX46/PRP5
MEEEEEEEEEERRKKRWENSKTKERDERRREREGEKVRQRNRPRKPAKMCNTLTTIFKKGKRRTMREVRKEKKIAGTKTRTAKEVANSFCKEKKKAVRKLERRNQKYCETKPRKRKPILSRRSFVSLREKRNRQKEEKREGERNRGRRMKGRERKRRNTRQTSFLSRNIRMRRTVHKMGKPRPKKNTEGRRERRTKKKKRNSIRR